MNTTRGKNRYSTSTLTILISSNGLSTLFTLTFSIVWTTSSPEKTRPNIVCFLSSHGVAVVVMKNCEPFVPGPALAMLTVYGLDVELANGSFHMCVANVPIVFELVREFILKLSPPDGRATSPIPEWVSSLDHKLGNDTMEYNTFEIPTSCVAHEVLHCPGCVVGEQPEMDISHRRVDDGRVGERGRTTFANYGGSCDGLFFASRFLIEDISIIKLAIPEESH